MSEAARGGRERQGREGRGRGRGRGLGGGRGRVGGRGRGSPALPCGADADSETTPSTTAPKQREIASLDHSISKTVSGRGGRGRGRSSRSTNNTNENGIVTQAGQQDQNRSSAKRREPKLKVQKSEKEDPKNKRQEPKINGNRSRDKPNSKAQKHSKKIYTGTSMSKNDTNSDSKRKSDTPGGTAADFSASIPPHQPQQTSDIRYGKGETITVLHVAEKPSIGQAIAKGLADRDSIHSRSNSLPVHEFSGPDFPKAPHATRCNHRVTSVAGHVFNVDFPDKYQSWDSVDPAELFHAPIARKPCKGSVVKHLQDEARNVDFIVLWLDCDREGENICFEVLDCCMHVMKSGGGNSSFDRVYRAYFSAISESDIKKAYNALGKPDKNQSMSVEARQELDLKIGVSFSRFQTRYFQGRYGNLDSAVLSYGPCQTPTLGFCVQRHIDIETFKPEPYWVLELGVTKRGRILRAIWESGRSFNKQKVENLLTTAIESTSAVKATSVVTREKKQGRPIPMNTVALLKACSKALGIGPHAAMQTAERLYLSGYLSYPRTESSAYPKSFDIRGTLEQQVSDNRWGTFVRDLLITGHNKSKGGIDMGDHPPIVPCRAARAHELSGDMARVYDLVVRHFIASVSPDALWRSTRVDFAIDTLGDKGSFILSGKELVSPGFLAILLHKEYGQGLGDEEEEEERAIPEFVRGEIIPLVNAKVDTGKVAVASCLAVRASLEIKDKVTTPPSYLTESELIDKMERYGIGTDASMATHIENCQKRNYVSLESGRKMVPTKLGLVLVQGYHQIDASLVLPEVRSDIEGQCNKIATGQASKDTVVKNAIALFSGKYALFVKSIEKMDVLFGSSFAKLEDFGKPFTRCGLTRRYLQLIPGPPPRLYNKGTESVYPLPTGGIVRQWTGRHCSVENCNFELCLYSVGQPERTFPLCPRCVNDPDFALLPIATVDPVDRADEAKEREIKKIAGKALVLECPLPDSHPLIDELTVSPDPDSDGVLMVDPHFGPKWRLVSTRDPTVIYLPQRVEKITILDTRDEVLNVRLMQVEFKDGESPLPNGAKKHVCCFANDTILQGLVRVFHGSDRLKASGRGGRGRGRGRGGRNRSGRGRGGRR
jgi:DNA topoisomerase III